MMVNGVVSDVEFNGILDDDPYDAIDVSSVVTMTSVNATNTLRGGININKVVKDSDGQTVENDQVFEAMITMHAPKDDQGNPDFSNLDTYYEGDTLVDSSVAWYQYYDGERKVYDSELIEAGILEYAGIDDDGYVYGKGLNHPEDKYQYYGSGWFMLDFNNSTGTLTGTIKLSPKYTIRFVNMATGIEYVLNEETVTHGMTPLISYEHGSMQHVDPDDPDSELVEVYTPDPAGQSHLVEGNTENNINVTNVAELVANIRVTKKLLNYEWSGESYNVLLESTASLPKVVKASLSAASGTENVTYDFGNIHFATTGTCAYETAYSGKVVNGVTYGNAVTVTVTVAENSDGELEITNVEGGTVDGSTITATVINKVVPISLYKIGNSSPSTALSNVKFKLYSNADCADAHLVTKDARGTEIGTNGEITTGSDGTVQIGILNAGIYYLQETVTQNGYNKLSELVTITVAEDGMISYSQESHSPSKRYNSNSNAENLVKANGGLFITGTDADGNATGYTITVNNSTGVELPNTGGPGTLLYTLSGIALMLGAALMYGFRLRRRERRFN